VTPVRPALAAVATVACLACTSVSSAGAGQAAPGRAAVQTPASTPARGPLDAVPLHYQLTVTPDFSAATFDGDLTIDMRVDKATTRITLDAVDLEIYGADIALPYDRQTKPTVTTDAAAGTVTFTTSARIYPGTIKLRIEYGGKLRADGRGFYLVRSQDRKYLLSQMEATDARRAFPCVDDPSYKASFAVSAVVEQKLTAISNGRLVSDVPAEKFGKHVLRFGTTPRMSTYLLALAVGEFACLETQFESVPIRVCATPEKKHLGTFVLEAARRSFQYHSQYFTFKYPFRKLDLVAVPGDFPGAMENSAAIFFDEGLLVEPDRVPEARLAEVAETISHEVAHQWLGDIVTMRWWDDLWLNEGLATWIASKPVAAWKPSWHLELAREASASEAMRFDAFRSARAVRSPVATEAEIEEAFDAMAYDKAAAVLGMIEAWIGQDDFRTALNTFIRTHAYENATAEDLWSALATVAGKPVDQVMRAFITQPGVPLVSVDAKCEADETVVTASVQRFGGSGAPWPVPLQVRGLGPTAPMLVFTPRLLTEQARTFRISGCFPAVIVNSGATGYFRTAFAPDALAHLALLATSRMTPVERIRLIDDQWALASAGLSAAGDYLAVVSALAGDSTPEVIEAIARGLAALREHVAGDTARQPFEAWVRKTFGPVAAALGWRPAPGEAQDRKRLRAAVLGILGDAGRDGDVLATARALFAADASGAQELDPALRAAVTRLAARTADADLLAAMQARNRTETLAAAGDAAFVTGTIERAMKDPASRDALPGLIAAGLENPAVNARVWTAITSRWGDVQPSLGNAFALSQIVAAAGAFCDSAARDEVQRFFADKAAPVARTLQMSLERIDACRDFRLRQEAGLAEWLTSR
jgi:aminopeptidase N